jgi:hypothetical protein
LTGNRAWEPNPDDPSFGDELRRRESPSLKAKCLRSKCSTGLFCVALGIRILRRIGRD